MRVFTIILFFAVLAIIACKKKSDEPFVIAETEIWYPDSIFYGKNILSLPDSSVLQSEHLYGMGAVLEKDAHLSLIITNFSTPDTSGYRPRWYYYNNLGWTGVAYDTLKKTEKFSSIQTSEIDLIIFFRSLNQQGSCKIDFYENSTTITSTKYFRWQ